MSRGDAEITRLIIQPRTDTNEVIEEFVVEVAGHLSFRAVERAVRRIRGVFSPVPYRLYENRAVIEWGASGTFVEYLLEFMAQPYVSGTFYLVLGAWMDHVFIRRRARNLPSPADAVEYAVHVVLLRNSALNESDLGLASTEENRDEGTTTVVLHGPHVEYLVVVRLTRRGVSMSRIREVRR